VSVVEATSVRNRIEKDLPNTDHLVLSCKDQVRPSSPLQFCPQPQRLALSPPAHRHPSPLRSPKHRQWLSHQTAGRWSTMCMLEHSCLIYWQERQRELVLCMLIAMTMPRLVHGKRNADHRGLDQKRPVNRCKLRADGLEELIALTTPMFLSTVAILLFAPGFNNLLVMIFSVASMTPSLHLMPIQVPPFSTALTAYSTYRY